MTEPLSKSDSHEAIWFCIQCLSRVGQGLAISLLEFNTFGHAICTILVYSLWWNKPLDIEEPEVIIIKPGDDMLAMIIAYINRGMTTRGQRLELSRRGYQGIQSPSPSRPSSPSQKTSDTPWRP